MLYSCSFIVAAIAVLFAVGYQSGVGECIGIAQLSTLMVECAIGKQQNCDVNLMPSLVTFTLRELPSPYTETGEQVMANHLPGNVALKEKVAIVTGATAGLGLETTRVLLKSGCHVVLAVRNVKKGEQVLAELMRTDSTGKGTILKLDTSDMDSVKNFAEEFLALGLPLHYLINNAGIDGADTVQLGKQGWESSFTINHLGHFLLTRLLEPRLLNTGTFEEPARVCYLSSGAHLLYVPHAGNGSVAERMKFQIPPKLEEYHPEINYGMSKAFNVLTAMEQQRRWGHKGTAVAVSAHPGVIPTDIFSTAGRIGFSALFFGPSFKFAQKNLHQGVSTTIHTLVSPAVPSEARKAMAEGGDGTPHHGSVYYMNNGLGITNPYLIMPGVAEETWRLSEELLSQWL